MSTEGAPRKALKLANPISEEQGYLRTSILPGLIEVAKRNHSRGFRDLALFEAGLVFLPGDTLGTAAIPPLGIKPGDEVLDGLYDGVPDQPLYLAAVLTGHDSPAAAGHTPRAWDWADALDIARIAGDVLGVEIVVSQGQHQAFHPGRAAQLALRTGEVLGYAGELHPKLLAAHDMPARSVALEFNADALFEAAADVIVARHISTYPVATQDVALVVPQDVPAEEVLDGPARRRRRAARRRRTLRRVRGQGHRGRQEVAGLQPALPGRGPHADRRRGVRGPRRRRGRRPRAFRSSPTLEHGEHSERGSTRPEPSP